MTLSVRRNAAMRAPLTRKGAHGTAPNAAQFGVLMCLPMASELLLKRERRLRWISDLWAALTHALVCGGSGREVQ